MLAAPRKVNPHPYPKLFVKGPVVNGKKVLARHLVTIIPVIADAE
jgi:hypothetical protein